MSTVIAGELIPASTGHVERLGAMVAQMQQMTSRSEKMPTIAPPSTTGTAPILRSLSSATASRTRCPRGWSRPRCPWSRELPRSSCPPPASVPWPMALIGVTSHRQREAHGRARPRSDPRRRSAARFVRIMRLAAAVLDRRSPRSRWCWSRAAGRELHIHMLIATALGVGLTRAARHGADDADLPQQRQRP